jgi:hypothetical protein
MEGNHTTCLDQSLFTSLRVAARAWWFLAQVKVTEVGEFYLLTTFEYQAYLVEERLDHVLGFALIEANLFKEKISEFCLGQGHAVAFVGTPGFLPGAIGGMNDAGRHWVPSNRMSPLNRVTLQVLISPRAAKAEISIRTCLSGMPMPTAISESRH